MATNRSRNKRSSATRDPGRDVLFVYIGWASDYDGEERVLGSHGWLSDNADDCSEMAAFKKRYGVFRCGIGSGEIGSSELDLVLVAKRPGTSTHRAVGIYLGARSELWNAGDTSNDWRGAVTRDAVRFPDHVRFALRAWPGSSGVRRWARREGVTEHAELLLDYRRACALATDVLRGRVPPAGDDPELAVFEGRLKTLFVKHRTRERSLRDAKVKLALREGDGRLRCEVPGCAFDFLETYGPIGAGYAQVHHTRPLSEAPSTGRRATLTDLAVVCANCHAMIHRGGESRSLDEVRPRRRTKAR